MNTRKWLMIALAALLCVSVLAGCGGKSGSSDAGTSAPASDVAEAVSDAGANEAADDGGEDAEAAAEAEEEAAAENGGESEGVGFFTAVSEGDFSITELGDGKCAVNSCTAEVPVIEVPETILGNTVVGIQEFAFSNCEAEEIILPDTVEYIEGAVFVNCYNLRSVDLGAGLQSIGQMAFNICPLLETVEFPDGMTTLDGVVFNYCDILSEVYIPASATEITGVIAYTDLCPNIVIVTPAGSAAEAVALANELPVQNP